MPGPYSNPVADKQLREALELGMLAHRMDLRVSVLGGKYRVEDHLGEPRCDWSQFETVKLILTQGGWLI